MAGTTRSFAQQRKNHLVTLTAQVGPLSHHRFFFTGFHSFVFMAAKCFSYQYFQRLTLDKIGSVKNGWVHITEMWSNAQNRLHHAFLSSPSSFHFNPTFQIVSWWLAAFARKPRLPSALLFRGDPKDFTGQQLRPLWE